MLDNIRYLSSQAFLHWLDLVVYFCLYGVPDESWQVATKKLFVGG
jgi:hypothetical protein